jgi:hypothetical protein
LVAAGLAPFAAASVHLLLTRWPSYRFTAFSDYAGLAISVLVGAVFIATLPIRVSYRVVSLLAYLPAIGTLLLFFMFWFIAVAFRDGL